MLEPWTTGSVPWFACTAWNESLRTHHFAMTLSGDLGERGSVQRLALDLW
jgi:hypothetical protein